MPPKELLRTPDWYNHDGPHRPVWVAKGAVIGYWYGQSDYKPAKRRRRDYTGDVPVPARYAVGNVDNCCSAYGFRKGYRFRNNDYSDHQSDEEIRRHSMPKPPGVHIHNPLAVARGAVIGYAGGRTGDIRPERVPADLISTCCAAFGFWDGFDSGKDVFFLYATKAERARHLDAARARRNEYGWG